MDGVSSCKSRGVEKGKKARDVILRVLFCRVETRLGVDFVGETQKSDAESGLCLPFFITVVSDRLTVASYIIFIKNNNN